MRSCSVKADPPSITIGDGCVVLSRSGQSRKVIAQVLSQESDAQTGLRTIWLDRVVHRRGEEVFVQGETRWAVSGAISTVLHEVGATPKVQ